MTLAEFLFAQQNIPFAVAVGVMLAFTLIEVASLAFGGSASEGLDSALDVESGEASSGAQGFLGWLHFGSIPTLIFLILCTMGFGLSGYIIQWAAASAGGGLLPLWLASLAALTCMLFVVRGLGGVLRKNLLKEHTESVSSDELIGKLATITLGETTPGKPSQAKLKDQFGTSHYVLVEPLLPTATYRNGDEVVLIERHGAVFKVIGRDDSVADITEQLTRSVAQDPS